MLDLVDAIKPGTVKYDMVSKGTRTEVSNDTVSFITLLFARRHLYMGLFSGWTYIREGRGGGGGGCGEILDGNLLLKNL